MATKSETNPAAGDPITTKNQVLQAGASAVQVCFCLPMRHMDGESHRANRTTRTLRR